MPEEHRKAIERYADRLRLFGPGPRALGWRDDQQQRLRFKVLAEGARSLYGKRVLDVGCGFGDLYDFLSAEKIDVHYTGCDISPDLLAIARERHPELRFELRDILEDHYPDSAFDYVLMSGLFNHRLEHNEAFLRGLLSAAFRASTIGVGANMMTDQVDYREDYLYYFNPESVLRLCQKLSRHVSLRHDYPLFEFTVFIYHNANRC